MTTKPQAELLDFLRHTERTAAAKAFLKRSSQAFVLEYGWWYEPADLPEKIVAGAPRECFNNATDLIFHDAGLVYCEGYAIFTSGIGPTIHACVTDGQGRAIDNTWAPPGVAYAGVPFLSTFLMMRAVEHRATIGLIDDWQNNWPLLRDLGDRSDEWLEQRGRGVTRLKARGESDGA
jgi:hypothetical protein